MIKLSFDQLIDENKFRSLKKGFLKLDMKFTINTLDSDIDYEVDNISYYKEFAIKTYVEKDEFGFSRNFTETDVELCHLNFHSDFLYPAIQNMLINYKMKFENYLLENNIWGTSENDNFCSFQMKKVEDIKVKVQLSEHLSPDIKKRTDDILNYIYLFISAKSDRKKIMTEDKIRLNLSKIDVVLFFQLLIASGHINSTSLQVSDFISRNFMYYDKSQNIFKEFVGTKVLVRKIRTGSSLNKSLNHLKAIFKSEDFYNCV